MLFVLGFVIGGCCGTIIACMCAASGREREDDRDE